ncbi:MAG TPA: hypothetical protein VLF18_19735 [Tahibacter sp.]|uniref:hypothetical protein n=1 Tax=Tahibacter sp. TaxID=2056211 RepID=UPI002CFDCA30|nr:hypothetical protein [Tahibacter sp.]HSX62422.1 hypothetical protein [Tahibacter sp.]
MDAIRDTDLILYHYRDGLSADELAAIGHALSASAALRARYAALQATLLAADAVPVPAADTEFERRIWQRWEAQTEAGPSDRRHAIEPRTDRRPRHRAGTRALLRVVGGALALVAALGVGFLLGRQPAGPMLTAGTGTGSPPATTQRDIATRVLDAYVVAHLRETEGVVLTAVNSDNAALLAGNRELAAGLLESNRLYAQAATRAGNARLANFLQQLEPLLIELANPAPTDAIQGSDGLRDYVDKTDLLFQLRATQARIEPQRPTSI